MRFISIVKFFLLFVIVMSLHACCSFSSVQNEKDFLSLNPIRFAIFNASLNRAHKGDLVKDLLTTENVQAKHVAEIIQRTQPDVLALLEFDYDEQKKAIELFQSNYLNVSQNGMATIKYDYVYVVPSNTGQLAPIDLNGDGKISLPQDAYGFGFFPGQYAFVLLSKYEIQTENIRSFQNFKWKDMPNALLPVKADSSLYYTEKVLDSFRLSSKNHIDIPIKVSENEIVHAIVAHPTPPVFDGLEDRNGTRNHDEIRLINDYVKDETYLYDDKNVFGGLSLNEKFIILGDMNADPFDGESTSDPIQLFETNALINQAVLTGGYIPASKAGNEASKNQARMNTQQQGNPFYDTSDFGDEKPNSGNLRVDYVLPSANLKIKNSGVFWPLETDSFNDLNNASDHKLVWVDVKF